MLTISFGTIVVFWIGYTLASEYWFEVEERHKDKAAEKAHAEWLAREEIHRQAEEARAHRRATDPVIARYYAGKERRDRLVRR